MSRHLSGEASSDEIRELQDILDRSPDAQQVLDILHSYFTVGVSESPADTGDADLGQKFRRILDQVPAVEAGPREMIGIRMPRKGSLLRVTSGMRRVLYFAAALAGLVVLAWGLFREFRRSAVSEPVTAGSGQVVARRGVRTKLVLPDGTQVWLNSSSKLKYPADFNIRSREVELEGEAYFDVVRDVQRPFIVHAAPIDVRVLGTTFTVKSYPQDETIEATLLRGAIEISRRDNPNAPRVILKPDEKLVLDKRLLRAAAADANRSVHAGIAPPAKPDISVNPVRTNIPDSEKVETAWLYNRLVFNGDSFAELAEKMERWYNVTIVFRDEDLYKYRFGGAFANESVQDALNALQLTAPFTYKINGDVIELHKK
jgi:ferric-dicitrate binding protein FerR (iron transport regulator)